MENRNTKAIQKQILAFHCTTTAFLFVIFHTNFEKQKQPQYCTWIEAYDFAQRRKKNESQLDFFIKKISKQCSFLLLY